MTSLGDDARETLKIAGLEKAKERSLEQHLRPRAPQTWTSVDQHLRTAVDSSSQPTPIEIGAVMSTCACCGKAGHEKARCRFRNATCSNCGKTEQLRAMCRQREKPAGKSSPSSSSGKSSGKGSASRGNRDKCHCCGQVGHRRPRLPSSMRELQPLWQSVVTWAMSVDLLVGTQVLGLSRRNPLGKRNSTCVGTVSLRHFLDSRWTFCLFATTPISRLTKLVTC